MRTFSKKIYTYILISRPGLYFQTFWLYLLPVFLSEDYAFLNSGHFWLGLVYVSFPLNLLAYGWNDFVDVEIDKVNPRKGNLLFGAKCSKEELQKIWVPIVCTQLLFVLVFAYQGNWIPIGCMGGIVAANFFYNLPENGFRGKPPLELINTLGYLFILPLSSSLNQVPQVDRVTIWYLIVFCIQAHLIGEIMDIEPDKKGGRRTTALILGRRNAKVVVILLNVILLFILFSRFHAAYLGSFILMFICLLIWDLLFLEKQSTYSVTQYKLFGVLMNVSGFASILWIGIMGRFS